MPTTVILGAARTPIGKLGGGLSTVDPTDLGATAITAALERADVAPDQVQHVIMGQVLQAGQGQVPSRQAQIKAGIPKEVSSETVNKVCASGLRASVLLDQAIRAGDVEVGVGGGMESMSKAPYLVPERALRLPDGRRQDARRDGPRRADQPVQRPPDVRRGHRDRRRARDHAARPRPLGAALPRARAGRDRRRAHVRRDRRGHGQGSQGRHRRRGRRGPAPRQHARVAGQAPRPGRQGGLAHRRQLAGRQRRRRRARARLRRVGAGQRQDRAGRDRRPRAVRQRLRLPGHHAGQRRAEGARQGGPAAGRHRPVGDQRGLRVGHAELDPHAQHRRGPRERQRRRRRPRPPDRRLGRAHPRRARARAAPARRRPRLRGDLLRRRAGRRRHPPRSVLCTPPPP